MRPLWLPAPDLMRGRVIVVLAVVLGVAGCGNDASPSRAASKTTATTQATSAASDRGDQPASKTGNGSRVPTTRAGAAPSNEAAKTPKTYPTAMPGVPRAPLEVRMARTCVKRAGVQSISVRSTPGFQVALATEWPDGGGHMDYQGWAVSVIPPSGEFTKSWTIPTGASYGSARTDVTVTNKDGSQIALDHPTWTIAQSC